MKHPGYPKAKNQYLGTSNTSLNPIAKQALNQTMKDFSTHLSNIISKKEQEKTKETK